MEVWKAGLQSLLDTTSRDKPQFLEFLKLASGMTNPGDADSERKMREELLALDVALVNLVHYKKKLHRLQRMIFPGKQGLGKIKVVLAQLLEDIRNGVTDDGDEHDDVCKVCGAAPEGWLVVCERDGCKNSWCRNCCKLDPLPEGEFYCSLVPDTTAPVITLQRMKAYEAEKADLTVAGTGWPIPDASWTVTETSGKASGNGAYSPSEASGPPAATNIITVETATVTSTLSVGSSDVAPFAASYMCKLSNCLGTASSATAHPPSLIQPLLPQDT
eukprot:jgi/Mesvir1/7002/Mv09138-RA.1